MNHRHARGEPDAWQRARRFGGRPGETDRPKGRHRAPGPPNIEKIRASGRVARKCVVIARAVHETGRREIIGLVDVGEAETEAFWAELLRCLARAHDHR